MGRLSAVFVAICMVLIAGSIGAVLYLRFGLNGTQSTIVALIALIGLGLLNAVSGRVPTAADTSGQIANLAHGVADLAHQVAELGRRVSAIEGRAQAVVEKTLAVNQATTAEMGEAGVLIKQIAETVAAHDTQLKVLAPASSATPAGPVAPPSPPPLPPISPLPPVPSVGAPAVSVAAPPPAPPAPPAPPPLPVAPAPEVTIAPLVAALPTSTPAA